MFCRLTVAAPVALDDFFLEDFFFLELEELEPEEESLPQAVSTSPAESATQRQRKSAVVRRIMAAP
jgi:hypothetical protein